MRLLNVLAQLGLASSLRKQSKRTADYSGYVVLRATPQSQSQVEALSEEAMEQAELSVDFWNDAVGFDAPVSMMFPGEQVAAAEAYLRSAGLAFEVAITDVQSQIDQTTPPAGIASAEVGFDLNQYHTFDAISSWMDGAAASNAAASLISIGKTFEGRQVNGLKINLAGGAKRPIIFLLCGIHSREWVTPAACMIVADKLMRGQVGSVADKFEWHIVPSGNADGYEYTWTTDRMWRTTRRQEGRCSGVDPNRNWDIKHCQEFRERNCGQTYCGPTPFSEVEVENVAKYLQGLQSSGADVKAFLDVHAFSQFWMWPYGYTKDFSGAESDMKRCGEAAVAALKAVHGKSFRAGTIARTIYQASGSSVDWTYDVLGIKYSYALELRDTGKYGFLLPADQIMPTAEEFLAGLEGMAECILAPPPPPTPAPPPCDPFCDLFCTQKCRSTGCCGR